MNKFFWTQMKKKYQRYQLCLSAGSFLWGLHLKEEKTKDDPSLKFINLQGWKKNATGDPEPCHDPSLTDETTSLHHYPFLNNIPRISPSSLLTEKPRTFLQNKIWRIHQQVRHRRGSKHSLNMRTDAESRELRTQTHTNTHTELHLCILVVNK